MPRRITIPDATREAILQEAGYRCAVLGCGTTLALDLHHIDQVRDGGGNDAINLVALCGTHHDLYHRGVISEDAVRKWKARLIALNQVDVRAEVRQALADAIADSTRASGKTREGFSLATAKFIYRTCEVGFVYDDTFFVPTGCCCFFAPKLALTTSEVVQYATDAGAPRGGKPVIQTRRGFAPFDVKKRYDTGQLVSLEIGAIDDAFVADLLQAEDQRLENYFCEPLQTLVKSRMVPFCGERVGFLHAPSNSDEVRSSRGFVVIYCSPPVR